MSSTIGSAPQQTFPPIDSESQGDESRQPVKAGTTKYGQISGENDKITITSILPDYCTASAGMTWPKNWVRAQREYLIVGGANQASYETPDKFLEIIRRTESLRALRAGYPATRSQLISALAHFEFDFMALLEKQIREGRSDVELAALHQVDAKWIASVRKTLGDVEPKRRGRPSTEPSTEAIIEAYQTCKSYSGAARLLRMDRRTFARRYQQAVRKA